MRGSVSVQDGSGWVRNRSWCCHHRWKLNATGMPICYFSLPQMFNVHVKTVVRRTLPSKHPGFRLKHNIRFLRTPTNHQQAASRIQIEQHSYLDHPSPMGLVLRILAPANQQSHLARMRMGRTDMKAHTWGRQDKSHPAKRHTHNQEPTRLLQVPCQLTQSTAH